LIATAIRCQVKSYAFSSAAAWFSQDLAGLPSLNSKRLQTMPQLGAFSCAD
jgi:hypothetical protein